MSTPLTAGPLPAWVPELARRRFRFTPAIQGVLHNEWTLRDITWDDVVVVNVASRETMSIPRRFFGDGKHIEDAVGVVTLLKRLEYADGRVRPMHRAVIEMRPADGPRVRLSRPAEVVEIREAKRPEPRWKHFLRVAIALGCLLCIVAVYVFRDAKSHQRVRRSSTRPTGPAPHQPESELLAPLGRR
jgi:hypothetical protein